MQLVGKTFAGKASVRVIDANQFPAFRDVGNGIGIGVEGFAYSPFTIAVGIADGLDGKDIVNALTQVCELVGSACDTVLMEDQFAFAPELQVIELGIFCRLPNDSCTVRFQVLVSQFSRRLQRAQGHHLDSNDSVGSLFDVDKRLTHVSPCVNKAGRG